MQPYRPTLVDAFGQHLLAIAVYFRTKDDAAPNPPRMFVASATMIVFDGELFLLTAGHVVQKIDTLYADPEFSDISCTLVDNFGHQAKHDHAIPFDWVSPLKFAVDQDGLDFGVVRVSPYYFALLRANGVEAIDEQNWSQQHAVKMDGYFLLGFPQELAPTHLVAGGRTLMRSVAAPLQKLTELPVDAAPVANPLFIGKLAPDVPIESAVGMSGGPIVGIRVDPDGVRYWVVAIQRSWFPNSRVVTGCPVPLFANILLSGLRNAAPSPDLPRAES